MSLTTLDNGVLKVTVSDLGAEMQSILDRDGEERLWQGDPAYWTGRAPIMFPVCSSLKEDAYLLDGRRYPMQKHGFARKYAFDLVCADRTSARYVLKHREEGFPFDYALYAEYSLEDNRIVVRYEVENHDSRTFYFGLGSHEAYRTLGGLHACTVRFEREEAFDHMLSQGGLLNHKTLRLGQGRDLPMKTEYFAQDALIFPYLKSRRATLVSSVSDKRVTVDYDGMDVLLLWTKPGAEYLCIEPWTNAPDFADTDMMIEHKPGMLCLLPGAGVVRRHTITID
jgi:galactose mutarotase-like enzyme